jgi:hypothetical protein
MCKELAEFLPKLNAEYCPFGHPMTHSVISCFEIYIKGHQHFDQTTHFSITGPDDYANLQAGNMLEALCDEPSVTTFSDLYLQPRPTNNKKAGIRIVHVHKRIRHSEDFERLCGCLRQKYHKEENDIPIIIIGRRGFISPIIQNRTISLYLPPFQNYVPLFSSQKVKTDVEKAKLLIKGFWDNHLNKIKECYDKFERIDWLKNQDEVLWTPILTIAKSISELSGDPSFLQNILTLAERLIISKKHLESALCKEGMILQATQAFIQDEDPVATIQDEDPIKEPKKFYRGDKLHTYVRKMLDRPRLTLSHISQILGDHHVIKDSYRDRFDVEDKEKSKGKEKVKKPVQYHCYQFDKTKLAEATNHYFMKGDKDGG